eukprot:3255263-Rhodomonas_salina.1
MAGARCVGSGPSRKNAGCVRASSRARREGTGASCASNEPGRASEQVPHAASQRGAHSIMSCGGRAGEDGVRVRPEMLAMACASKGVSMKSGPRWSARISHSIVPFAWHAHDVSSISLHVRARVSLRCFSARVVFLAEGLRHALVVACAARIRVSWFERMAQMSSVRKSGGGSDTLVVEFRDVDGAPPRQPPPLPGAANKTNKH